VAFGGHKARQDDGNVSRGMGRRLESEKEARRLAGWSEMRRAGSARVLGACNRAVTITDAISDAGAGDSQSYPRAGKPFPVPPRPGVAGRSSVGLARGWNKSSSAPFAAPSSASRCANLNNESGAQRKLARVDRCSHQGILRRNVDRSRDHSTKLAGRRAGARAAPFLVREIFTLRGPAPAREKGESAVRRIQRRRENNGRIGGGGGQFAKRNIIIRRASWGERRGTRERKVLSNR